MDGWKADSDFLVGSLVGWYVRVDGRKIKSGYENFKYCESCCHLTTFTNVGKSRH